MYTKGKWEVVIHDESNATICLPDNESEVTVFGENVGDNAHLIAKSPRMYEWIKELPLHVGCVYIDDDNPAVPTFTIDTDYLQLSKEVIKD